MCFSGLGGKATTKSNKHKKGKEDGLASMLSFCCSVRTHSVIVREKLSCVGSSWWRMEHVSIVLSAVCVYALCDGDKFSSTLHPQPFLRFSCKFSNTLTHVSLVIKFRKTHIHVVFLSARCTRTRKVQWWCDEERNFTSCTLPASAWHYVNLRCSVLVLRVCVRVDRTTKDWIYLSSRQWWRKGAT